MAMKKAEKFEGIKKMLLKAYNEGNNSATSEGYCVDCGLSWEVYSMYNGYISELCVHLYPYYKARREESELGAEQMSEKDRKELKKPVWKAWSELLHGIGLKCHQDDFEMLWACYERFGKDNKGKVTTGGNTPYYFRKKVDRELGIRLHKVKTMTPVQMEYETELRRLTRQVAGLENRIKTEAGEVEKWKKTLDSLDKDNPAYSVIEDMLTAAEAAHDETAGKLEKARDRKAACTLENVERRIEAESAIKKLTAEDRKKEKEEKEKEKKEEKKEEAK